MEVAVEEDRLPKKRKAHNRERYLVDDKIRCPSCDQWKVLDEFHKWNKGLYGASRYCKLCSNEKARRNHVENRAKGTDGWDKHREGYRDRYYKKYYGISLQEFEEKFLQQDCKCAICEVLLDIDEDSRKAHLDHCHESGKIRGILCVNCNQGIGSMKENIFILNKAIMYLEEHSND